MTGLQIKPKRKPKPTEGGKFSTKLTNFLAGVVWETL